VKVSKAKKKNPKVKKTSDQDAKITSSSKQPKKSKGSKGSKGSKKPKGSKRSSLPATIAGNETVTQPWAPAPEAEPKEAPAPAYEELTNAAGPSVEELEDLYNGGTAVRESPAQPEVQPTPTQVPPETETEQIQIPAFLRLLGSPTLYAADGSRVTGKPAEAVAYLHLNMFTGDGTEIFRALWPEEASEGNNARARRSRTTRKIKDALPGTFRVEESQWIIDPLLTDLDYILATFAAPWNLEDTMRACELIEVPLHGCAAWADEPRAQIMSQLRQFREWLEDVMDWAFDSDQFELAKVVRRAIKKLQGTGESA
jgi:hypothetical protein